MVKCKRCKNPLPETAHFCPNCGLVRDPDKKRRRGKKRNESEEESMLRQTDFGNYYEDIIPEDAEELKNRKSDNSLVLKFALLGFGHDRRDGSQQRAALPLDLLHRNLACL